MQSHDRFLKDFFGITKYLVVYYYCLFFQSYNYLWNEVIISLSIFTVLLHDGT